MLSCVNNGSGGGTDGGEPGGGGNEGDGDNLLDPSFSK